MDRCFEFRSGHGGTIRSPGTTEYPVGPLFEKKYQTGGGKRLCERPYKCHLPECGRAFIQLSNLQQHLRNHDAQVERAKNRPFHCNICGKGFATESSLRTHTSKELQLRVPVLQQHAALIGGPNATSCPICHKLFLGGEALMEHMKHTHKDPNASGVANPYLAKRRTANHPCPVCGKHYVNEGSLRKHLACHPETSQLTTSLRMWPCSVCQAVFTHESGLLSHMEHMRMDPKHQFAAQYVLSRAAAERRERESLLAAAVAASSAGGLAGLGGGGPSSMCASPSAHSDSSSGGGRLSSTGSEPGGIMNNNNNNNKLGDILGGRGGNGLQQQYGAEDLHNASPAAVNLAAAMRMGASGLGGVTSPGGNNGNNGSAGGPGSSTPPAPGDGGVSAAQAQAAMNAAMRAASMADSMRSMDAAMRSSMAVDSAMRLDSMTGHHHGVPQGHHNHQQSSGGSNNGGGMNHHHAHHNQVSPDLSEALRLQEQRLEQALRLHGGDPRALGFSLSSSSGNSQNQQQQQNNP
ncbi:zinc finger and BTB domain-containing protein 49-like [Zootermopsis nevadensis]|uniref:zinc finger and BTB domain-containing protein 49-like n=1 Tax=Zootermopsis nevadensis TaxID=136037 RepID=UPI000B8E66C3|nr:zinc finger and BTB domain-containing protein 49-like [Zootermopsis nevadensis]